MDITTIVNFVLKALITYVPLVAGEIAKGSLSEIGAKLLNILTEKFQKDRDASIVLKYFLVSPSDKNNQERFSQKLRKFLEHDQAFYSQLEAVYNISTSISSSVSPSGDYNTITSQVAQTLVNVNPDSNATIYFIFGLNGMHDAISRLKTFVPPQELQSITPFQYIDFLYDLQTTIKEHKLEIETDIAVVTELLKPAVAVERSEQFPNPSRFLQNVILQIGQNLQEARIFDNFGMDQSGDIKDGKFPRSLPLPELAESFFLNESEIFFVRSQWHPILAPKPKKTNHLALLEKFLPKDNAANFSSYFYRVTYKGWDVFKNMGEYHIGFSNNYSYSLYYSNLDDDEIEKHRLDPENIAKFLRALLAFYIRQMRFPEANRLFFKGLESG
jgi:hypothetical protein